MPGLVAAFASFSFAPAAVAQTPAPPAAQPPAADTTFLTDDDEPLPPGRPLPRDDRTGRFSAFGGIDVVVPGGDLGAGLTLPDVASVGFAAEAGVGIGVTRYSSLMVRGQFASFGQTTQCATCTVQMFAIGLGLTYHASQALGFDPWVRFGTGYRSLSFATDGTIGDIGGVRVTPGTSHGIDLTSFTLGGDFFPVPWLGLGVYLAGDVGIAVSTPDLDARGAVYGLFHAGLRIALEPQRKAVSAASGGPGRTFALQERSDLGPPLYNPGAR